MGFDFSQKQCVKALLKIGFTEVSQRRGKHFKFRPPQLVDGNAMDGIRPFIMVPRHKFYCQNAIVNEIAKICGEEMKKLFLENL